MTARDTSTESIANIRENIHQALKNWDSSNPTSMSASEALLQRSAADLQRFHDAVAAGIAPGAAIRLELLSIRSSVNRLLRVVDASSAFVAGISGATADRGVFYDAAGAAGQIGSLEEIRSEGPVPCRTF